jgi:hypothetical protein
MKFISIDELKNLANGEDFVFTLERLLLEDSLAIYDDRTGKPIWYIHDMDTLIDGVDIIGEKLKELSDDQLILEYYYRWSLAQFYFCDDRLHQVKVKVYLSGDGYRIEKFHDDGTYEVEKVPNERKLIDKMSWHGYGRVLYFTYIDDDIPKEILRWIRERGSWAKILIKETI